MTEHILRSVQELLNGLYRENAEEVGLAVSQVKARLADARQVLVKDDAQSIDSLIRRRDQLQRDVDRLTRLTERESATT